MFYSSFNYTSPASKQGTRNLGHGHAHESINEWVMIMSNAMHAYMERIEPHVFKWYLILQFIWIFQKCTWGAIMGTQEYPPHLKWNYLYFLVDLVSNVHILVASPTSPSVAKHCYSKAQSSILMATTRCTGVALHAIWTSGCFGYLRIHGHRCQLNKDVLTWCINCVTRKGLWWRHFVFFAEVGWGNTILLFNFM